MTTAILLAWASLAAAAPTEKGGPLIALPLLDDGACTATLPETLSLGDAATSRVGKLFAAEWADRIKAARAAKAKVGGARSCRLAHRIERVENRSMTLFNSGALLSCGDEQIIGAGAALDEAGAEEMIAFSLAHLAAQAFCDPKGYVEGLRRAERQAKLRRDATAPARCPAGLEVDAKSEREASLVKGRWQSLTGGRAKGAPINCTFERKSTGSEKQTQVRGSLTCGASRLEASARDDDGTEAERKVVDELVSRLLGDRCGRGPHARDPLNCAAMPKSLAVKGPLAKALTEQLEPIAGEAKAPACTSKATTVEHPRLPNWVQSSAELRCGKETFRAVGLAAVRSDAENAVAAALVNAMREKRCPLE